jgi:hypothetical protein
MAAAEEMQGAGVYDLASHAYCWLHPALLQQRLLQLPQAAAVAALQLQRRLAILAHLAGGSRPL